MCQMLFDLNTIFGRMARTWKHSKIRWVFWNGVTFGLIGLDIELLMGLIVGQATKKWCCYWIG